MGTRGTVHFTEGKRKIGSLHMQYDAYPHAQRDERLVDDILCMTQAYEVA